MDLNQIRRLDYEKGYKNKIKKNSSVCDGQFVFKFF